MTEKGIFIKLNPGSNYKLDKLETICGELVKYAIANPGNISNYKDDDLLSLRKLIAKYNNTPEELCNMFSANMAKALRNYFPNTNLYVDVENGDPDSAGRYDIAINIKDDNGYSIIPMKTVKIDSNKLDIIDQ